MFLFFPAVTEIETVVLSTKLNSDLFSVCSGETLVLVSDVDMTGARTGDASPLI